MFANPVPGIIQAKAEAWKGTPTFRQVRTCADHMATGTGCAQDFGNGREGEPVYAMDAGKVTSRYIQNTPGKVGHGSLIMRVTHAGRLDGGGYWSTGYAHLRAFSVGLGAVVARGQQIGIVGSSGVPGQPHLHCDAKQHTSANPQGIATDLWPLLDQQTVPPAPGGTDMLQGTNPVQLNNKVCSVLGASTRFRAAPAVGTTPVLAVYGAGTAFTPDWQVDGAAVGGSTTWYGGWGQTPKGLEFGYLHASVVSPPAAYESSGYSQAELDAAVDKAEAEAEALASKAVATAANLEAAKYQ